MDYMFHLYVYNIYFFLCISFLYIRSLWILHGALTAQSTWVHPNTFHCGLVSRYDVFTRYHLRIPSRVSIDSIGKGVSSFHILCSKLDTVQWESFFGEELHLASFDIIFEFIYLFFHLDDLWQKKRKKKIHSFIPWKIFHRFLFRKPRFGYFFISAYIASTWCIMYINTHQHTLVQDLLTGPFS